MKLQIFFSVALLFFCSLSHAAPSVTGSIISWPDDGWYQVQDEQSYNELCAGTRFCEVNPGSYIVINHSTGERFTGIKVVAVNESDSPIVVSGNVISWPDDGWYQVQDSQTYASICNGTRFCRVPFGTYIIINHTRQQRFEPILVPAVSIQLSKLEASRYSVSAGELFWERVASELPINFRIFRDGMLIGQTTGNSYFDDNLQDARAYQYEVINDITGARASISLEQYNQNPDITDPPIPPSPQLDASNAQDILKQVISIINEDQIDLFFEKLQTDSIFNGRQFFLSNTTDEIMFAQSMDHDTPYQLETDFETGTFADVLVKSEYICAGGGTVSSYRSYIHNLGSDRVFTDCAIGKNTYNGTTGRRNDQARGLIRAYPFYNFSATDAAGITSTLTGGYRTGNTSFVVLEKTEGWTNAEFTTTTSEGYFTLTDFNINRSDRTNSDSASSYVSGSFIVTAPWSNNQALAVTVYLGYRVSLFANTPNVFQWQEGVIEVLAEDGSNFTASPSDSSTDDLTIVLDNGESIGPIPWSGDFAIDCGSAQICPEQ